MTMNLKKQKADYLLLNMGLVEELSRFGEVHTVGSCRTGLMATNDIDLYVDNSAMSLELLHELTVFILNTFKPVWYEAKEEYSPDGDTIYFHGFETVISGERWNFDIWFFDKKTIMEAEELCSRIEREIIDYPAKKDAVLEIKNYLITKGLYSYDKFTGMDVYRAVFDENIITLNAFIKKYEL